MPPTKTKKKSDPPGDDHSLPTALFDCQRTMGEALTKAAAKRLSSTIDYVDGFIFRWCRARVLPSREVMRQLIFIGIMIMILTPLASFGSDNPFAGLQRVSDQVHRVEALHLVCDAAEQNYYRVKNLLCQRIAEFIH